MAPVFSSLRKVAAVGGLAFFSRLNQIEGHSWLQQVNNSPLRGGCCSAGDTALTRYVCPSGDLAQCQPEAKHGIVLTSENLRPCRPGKKSSPMANVANGGDLNISWASNGHSNSQSDGTCVKVKIAPYNSDPAFSDFTTIPGGECLPYHKNGGNNNATLKVPDGWVDGEYTILWYWDFGPFIFGGCADIEVGAGGNGGSNPNPNPPATTKPDTNPTQSTLPPSSGSNIETYDRHGCTALPGSFCKDTFGNSYCKDWKKDSCGRAVCQGQGSLKYECGSVPPSDTTPKPSTPTTPPSSGNSSYLDDGCIGLPADFCKEYKGSYCKSSGKDSCGRAVCQGDSHNNLNKCRRALKDIQV